MPSQSQTRKIGRPKRYQIHDNGGRPFAVGVNQRQKKLGIYRNVWDLGKKDYGKPLHLMDYSFKQIWIGEDSLHIARGWPGIGWDPKWKGNSILAQLTANRFLYIGSETYEFTLMAGDAPVIYSSYVGNNDVPYPYLIGKTHTYLMLEGVAIPNEVLDLKKDAYGQYYGYLEGSKGVEKAAKKFVKKVVLERIL
jgi:hypothetical protein